MTREPAKVGTKVETYMNKSAKIPIIKKVAILGAGVMGAQIAAHFANAGIAALLFDLPGRE